LTISHCPPQGRSPVSLSQAHFCDFFKVTNCLFPLQSRGTSQPSKQKGVPFVGLKTFLQSARTITFPFETSVDDGLHIDEALQVSDFADSALQNTKQLDNTTICFSIILLHYYF